MNLSATEVHPRKSTGWSFAPASIIRKRLFLFRRSPQTVSLPEADPRAGSSGRKGKFLAVSVIPIWLFLICFALVFYGTGASFVESFVNYPTWRLIGANEFRAYHQTLGPLIIGYMVIPMLITTLLIMLLLWFKPPPIPQWAVWLAVVLQLISWASTVAIQLPIQWQLSRDGLSLPLIERLIFTNWWLRKVPQIINTLLFLWLMSLLLRGEPSTAKPDTKSCDQNPALT